MARVDPLAYFWQRVERDTTGCWLWTGAVSPRHGYGQGLGKGAHRLAWELLVGPIPPGLVIDHLCRVRRCVNPAHMEPVTLAENTRRGMGYPQVARRTNRCRNGHSWWYTRPDGRRYCVPCRNAYDKRRYDARKSPAA